MVLRAQRNIQPFSVCCFSSHRRRRREKTKLFFHVFSCSTTENRKQRQMKWNSFAASWESVSDSITTCDGFFFLSTLLRRSRAHNCPLQLFSRFGEGFKTINQNILQKEWKKRVDNSWRRFVFWRMKIVNRKWTLFSWNFMQMRERALAHNKRFHRDKRYPICHLFAFFFPSLFSLLFLRMSSKFYSNDSDHDHNRCSSMPKRRRRKFVRSIVRWFDLWSKNVLRLGKRHTHATCTRAQNRHASVAFQWKFDDFFFVLRVVLFWNFLNRKKRKRK